MELSGRVALCIFFYVSFHQETIFSLTAVAAQDAETQSFNSSSTERGTFGPWVQQERDIHEDVEDGLRLPAKPSPVFQFGTATVTYMAEEITVIANTQHGGFELGKSDWAWYLLPWTWWVILQLVSAILGILGNGVVMTVLFQRRAHSRSTDTLVGGLAVADFITSVCMVPLPLAIKIPRSWLGEVYCKIIVPNHFMWLSVGASSYTLVAISVERYIAVVHPIYFKQFLTRRSISVVICIIWFWSTVSVSVGLFTTSVDETGSTCAYKYFTMTGHTIMAVYSFASGFAIPVVVMLVSQLLIARELRRQSLRFKGQVQRNESFHDVARRRVIRLMLFVIIIYVICWSPMHVSYTLWLLGFIQRSIRLTWAQNLFIVMGLFNSCLNPIIYTARFKEFRMAVWEMLSCKTTISTSIFEHDNKNTTSPKTLSSKVPTSSLNVV